MSVQTDHGPRSISRNGALLSNPTLADRSWVSSGPKLVIISVLPPMVKPITRTPWEAPGNTL